MKINDLVASRKIKLKIEIFKRDNLNHERGVKNKTELPSEYSSPISSYLAVGGINITL